MTWFDDMAAVMRRRETALNGVKRWQEKLAMAEADIAKLGAQAPATAEPAPAPQPQPAAEPVLEGPIDVNWQNPPAA